MGLTTTTAISAWTNVTLYNIIPASLLRTTPTSTADMWLADAFNAACESLFVSAYQLAGRAAGICLYSPVTRLNMMFKRQLA